MNTSTAKLVAALREAGAPAALIEAAEARKTMFVAVIRFPREGACRGGVAGRRA